LLNVKARNDSKNEDQNLKFKEASNLKRTELIFKKIKLWLF